MSDNNPQETAEKFINNDLEKPKDGYDGFQRGSSSLVNNATKKVSDTELE